MTAVACALAFAFAFTPAAGAAPALPDLVSDPPVGGNQPVVHDDAEGVRLLLRLDGFVHNRGPGALEIRGADPAGGVMGTVRQRVYDDGGGGFTDIAHAPAPLLRYETNDDHAHWHLRHAMRYSLWSADRTFEVGPAQKVGFCLVDSLPVEADFGATPVYTVNSDEFCQSEHPGAPSVFMGVSAGWRDKYSYVLAFQWIDISDVAPGSYWLRTDADPDGVIAESDELNPGAYDEEVSVVNGYRADPVAAGAVAALGATPIALAATRFDDVHLGSPGAPEFRIVTPPAGGTLDRPVGTWFSGAQVQYTPKPGFSGADAFTVAARDAESPFPRTPRSAAVTLAVQGSTGSANAPAPGVLGISGAPESVYTSSETQLTASGPGVEQGVTWSVDGVDSASAPAGSPTAGGVASGATAVGPSGTISAGGLYRAPATPPAAGSAVIGARSATGATGAVTIGVVSSPPVRPAPTIAAPPVPAHGLSKLRLGRYKSSLIAVVSSATTGRARFTARRNGRRIGFCSMIVRGGSSATCMLKLTKAIAPFGLYCPLPRTVRLNLPGVTVTATLTRRGRVVATRRGSAR